MRCVTMLEGWRERLQEIAQNAENVEFVKAAANTLAREMGTAMTKGYKVVQRYDACYGPKEEQASNLTHEEK